MFFISWGQLMLKQKVSLTSAEISVTIKKKELYIWFLINELIKIKNDNFFISLAILNFFSFSSLY